MDGELVDIACARHLDFETLQAVGGGCALLFGFILALCRRRRRADNHILELADASRE